ncbi:Transcription elongation factor, mitochondrial [Orchesella cincta]|uniref:Transcription elongation factor, mitochondrial n=1 Tax=Orchesella cincta TaxID=48709 RepID=A0A1D2MD45_ORCCI|nr:Transcription elongation factor, mitochondrial [Orchesella cincta]
MITRNFSCPNCCFSSLSKPFQLRSRRSNSHKLRSSVTGHQYFVTSALAHSSTDLSTDSLTAEEAAKVLKIVNEVQRSEDLLKYFIPKKKADELVKRKNGREEILLLEEVISIVGPKNSNKFFCSVLDKPIPVSASAALFPPVTTEEINKTSSVLGLIIVGDRISWSVMDREMRQSSINLDVKTLRQVNYAFKPRMHFLTLLQEMGKVASHIPETEMCLVEEYPATVPTPYMFNFQLQMAQAKAMLLGILNSREKRPLIISIKTVAVARLFKTYVGHEKVSGQHLVDDMLLNKHLPYIEIPDRVLDAYINADSKVKEGLSQAFLLNLAYWRITKQQQVFF